MPDLVTHLVSGYVADAALKPRQPLRLAFLLGVLLPDLLTRPVYILFPGTDAFVMPLHTPIGYAITCWLIVQFADQRNLRRDIMHGLITGGILHFALDALQRQFDRGYEWMFPICRCQTTWGLLWPETSVDWLPATLTISVIAYALLSGRLRRETRRSGSSSL